MILDIRGTHGSGKSWIVHQLLAAYGRVPVMDAGTGQQLGYRLKGLPVGVVGRYETACGGCDGIKDANEVVRRVRLFSGLYRLTILEGILVSHSYGRYRTLADELAGLGRGYTFAFLDTPHAECVRRVQARRHAAGDTRPMKTHNLDKDYQAVWNSIRHKATADGYRVLILDHLDPMPPVLKLMDEVLS